MKNKLRASASVVLAKAVEEIVPHTFPLQGGACPLGFFYDFVINSSVSEELFPHIEERMRNIIREEGVLTLHEMIPSNAQDFFRARGAIYPAQFVKNETTPLVHVLQLGSFATIARGKYLETLDEAYHFRLVKMEERPPLHFKGEAKKVIRIYGMVESEKALLKEQLKKGRSRIGETPYQVGEQLHLLTLETVRGEDYLEEERVIWRGEGEALFHSFYLYLRKLYEKGGFELIRTPSREVSHAHQRLFSIQEKKIPTRFAEIRFSSHQGEVSGDIAHTFCVKETLPSLLEKGVLALEKVATLFSFDAKLEVTAPAKFQNLFESLPLKGKIENGKEAKIAWHYKGFCGELVKGPFLTVSEKKGIFVLRQSFFPSVEGIIRQILADFDKDLSQKKELLRTMQS